MPMLEARQRVLLQKDAQGGLPVSCTRPGPLWIFVTARIDSNKIGAFQIELLTEALRLKLQK